MAYLLDTDILSAIRRKQRDPNLERWLHSVNANELFLSVARKETILLRYQSRILPMTVGIARRWGHLSAVLGHCSADLMIAATAFEHDLIVATRNTRHFEPTQVALINPFFHGR